MRWNCPHCRTQLDSAGEVIPATWAFALCAHCARFGLIRKYSQLAVKVDRAPPGEIFIRTVTSGPAPVVRPAQLRSGARTGPIHGQVQRKTLEIRLPEPLPEVPRNRVLLSKLLLIGCMLLLGWNGYRYHRLAQEAHAETAVDSITANAMAPERIEVGSQIAPHSLNVLVRNNPGPQSHVVGALDPTQRYTIQEIQAQADGSQWYRIETGAPSPAWVSVLDVGPAH